MKITQLDAAKRQLATAIHLYLKDDDPVSVHTLVSAAGEIIDRLCEKNGLISMRNDLLGRANAVGRRREISDKLNAPKNFFKHGSENNSVLELFSDDWNLLALIQATDALRLLGERTIPSDIFGAWVAIVEPDLMAAPHPNEVIEPIFGDIRNQPRNEQKKVGFDCLHHALTGRLPS